MDLDTLDRQVVHALQVDRRAPFSRIAALLGASDRTIARRYGRLREAGALRVVGLPDAATLGHVDWLVRMRCSPDTAVPVAAALARREDTSWVTLVSGGTEITCITRTRSQSADGDLLLQRLPRTPRISVLSAHCMLRGVAGLHGYHAEAMMWLTVAPSALSATTRALATHPQIACAAATTGPANIAASVICRDLNELYEYIAGDIGSLDGVASVETAPVVRRVKAGGTLLVT
ncbi:Lrp/AsnC family transcriptional regulator [Dactylosporangium sp. NPDC050588]|uniref:Lrp/AsnC family transcriptional regulator n=1 Tax=Dactylosporangium sp. NPDC050588 TaxID=3157211 RepID=UPI0033D7AFD2